MDINKMTTDTKSSNVIQSLKPDEFRFPRFPRFSPRLFTIAFLSSIAASLPIYTVMIFNSRRPYNNNCIKW